MSRQDPRKNARIFLAAAVLASLCACAKSTEQAAQPAQATVQPAGTSDVSAALARAREQNDQCAFVTQSEMRAIVHAPVVGHTVNGGNACVYETSGVGARAKVQVDRGDGRIAMKSAGAMSGRLAGVENPLAGVGDQAVQAGPTIMVRSGEDLVSIEMSGVSQPIEKAKAIFKLVKRKL